MGEIARGHQGKRNSWWGYAVLLIFVVIAILVALFFLRPTFRYVPTDAAYSVSNAPGS